MATPQVCKLRYIAEAYLTYFGGRSLFTVGLSSFEGFSRMATCSSISKPFTVFVEGNIGSGKTTFLKHFENLGNVSTLAEPVDLWRNVRGENLLGKMYSDPSRWGMTLQSYIQLTMLDLHTRPVHHPIKMMERSLHSARYCFVENLLQTGLMPHPDFVVLDEWFKWISKNHDVSGDLIIYLRTNPEVVHKRIMARARTEESLVPMEYLQQLHVLHENWLLGRTSFTCPAPVMVIDANQDIDRMKEEFLNCERRIREALAKPRNKTAKSLSPSKMNGTPIKKLVSSS